MCLFMLLIKCNHNKTSVGVTYDLKVTGMCRRRRWTSHRGKLFMEVILDEAVYGSILKSDFFWEGRKD